MREAFDVMGSHPLLTLFLGFVAMIIFENLMETIVNIIKSFRGK